MIRLDGPVLTSLLLVGRMDAQVRPAATVEGMVAELTRASAALATPREAMTAGYRRLGADFPGMGEHWVLPAAIFGGQVEQGRPSLLTFAEIGGVARLVGAGFVVPVRGDTLPHDLPGWPTGWHEHSGSFADETAGVPSLPLSRPGGVRVWVLHAWIGLPNPAGTYVAENWQLPFVRAGVTTSRPPGERAGRAMSLTVGGDVFLASRIADLTPLTPAQQAAVDSAIITATARVRAIREASGREGLLVSEDLDRLSSIWDSLSAQVFSIVGDSARLPVLTGNTHLH